MNMYDTFKQMIKDIFDNEDFIEWCYINGIKYKCLVSSISNDLGFTEVGLVDYVNFTLDIELSDNLVKVYTVIDKSNELIIILTGINLIH